MLTGFFINLGIGIAHSLEAIRAAQAQQDAVRRATSQVEPPQLQIAANDGIIDAEFEDVP